MKAILHISDICERLAVITDLARHTEMTALVDPGNIKHAAGAVSMELQTLSRQLSRQSEVVNLLSIGAYRGEPNCSDRLARLEQVVEVLTEARK